MAPGPWVLIVNDIDQTRFRPTVGVWRQRFIDLRIPGLQDLPKPGRESKLDLDRVRKVLTEVVQPPIGRKRWSCRTMGRHAGLSKATVQRLGGQ